MVRVRIQERYQGWYWDSGTGVTLNKTDRIGKEVDEDDKMVRLGLDQEILELVTAEEVKKQEAIKMDGEKKEEKKEEPKVEEKPKENIITDTPQQPAMKEVVNPTNTVEMNKAKEEANKNVGIKVPESTGSAFNS